MKIDKFKLVPSPYYHQLKNGEEHIGGWGIWDDFYKDWFIPDGYINENEALIGIQNIKLKGFESEFKRIKDYWHTLPCPRECEMYMES